MCIYIKPITISIYIYKSSKNGIIVKKWALIHKNIHDLYKIYIPKSMHGVLHGDHDNTLQHWPTA